MPLAVILWRLRTDTTFQFVSNVVHFSVHFACVINYAYSIKEKRAEISNEVYQNKDIFADKNLPHGDLNESKTFLLWIFPQL